MIQEIRVRGIVQGVGFRPTVYRLAQAWGLRGEVLNDGKGVLIRVVGNRETIGGFLEQLQRDCPPLAQIKTIVSSNLANIPQQVLLMGLGGSLSPRYRQGDGLIFSECVREGNYQDIKKFDESLTTILLDKLQDKISLVRGLSCDRLLINAMEKQSLGQEYQVDAVEMEGFTVLEILQPLGVKVAMIRVISDDYNQDLPDLTEAITPNGSLNTWQLIIKMLQSPVAAFGLIQGSLTGLKKLEILTGDLV